MRTVGAGMRSSHIERTIAYMDMNMNKNFTRTELADIAGINPDHFTRAFKKYTGLSPTSYISRLRMDKAKELLAASPSSIIEVARRVGYDDPSHFSRRFKQIVGVAPTAYMARPDIRIAALDGYGHCMALGIMPVAADFTAAGRGLWKNYDDVADVASGVQGTVDLTRLAALKPDVIITMNRANERELADIAPILPISVFDDPVYVQLRQIASFLGREKEAEAWIQEYEARSAVLRRRLAKLTAGRRKVAILRVRTQLLQVYGFFNMGYPFYASLQLEPPDRIQVQSAINAHFHSSPINVEELPYYEADHLFVVIQPDAGARQRWQELIASPTFQSYPAVASGRIYQLEVDRWLVYDPVSIRNQMEEAVSCMLGETKSRNYPSLAQD